MPDNPTPVHAWENGSKRIAGYVRRGPAGWEAFTPHEVFGEAYPTKADAADAVLSEYVESLAP